MIVAAQQLEVFLGTPSELHHMSLYEINGIGYATFTAEDPSTGCWLPVPPPRFFIENDSVFESFKADLAVQGYTYRNPCSARQ